MTMSKDQEALTSPLEKEISWMQQMSDTGILVEGKGDEWSVTDGVRPEPGTTPYVEVMSDGEARMYKNKLDSPEDFSVIETSSAS